MICARFYTELYSSTFQDQHPSLKNTSSDSSEVPLIMISEVKKTLNEIKSNKATGIDKLASDVMILRGEISVKQMPTKFYKTDNSKWKEAKIIIQHKKETRETFKITGLSVCFPTCTNCSHGHYKQRMENVLEEKQPREQAGFRKGYSTIDHLHATNHRTEKWDELRRPLCIGYIHFEMAFDSLEQEAIFKALRSIGINETYITILEDIYTGATGRVHMDNQVSEEIPILRGVRQGDPIST